MRTQWDRIAAWSLIAIGAIVLVLGYVGVAGTPFPAEQLPFIISGGIGGGILVVVGAALLVSADLRDEWHKLDRIEQVLRAGARKDTSMGDEAAPISPNGQSAPVVDDEVPPAVPVETAAAIAAEPQSSARRGRGQPLATGTPT